MIACTLENTSSRSADGYRSSESNRDAAYPATTARPSAAAKEIARRGPAWSSIGTRIGAATASGNIVRRRYRATLPLASPTGTSKKIECARANATNVSPATLAKCASP